jgi:hypothetical protein
MKLIKTAVVSLFIAIAGVVALVPATPSYALDPLGSQCANNTDNEVCKSQDDSANDLVKTIINVLLYIVGLLAVVMIIVGGILYAISSGDPSKITKAKNTIVYSVVGLILAFIAYAIVNWVIQVFA